MKSHGLVTHGREWGLGRLELLRTWASGRRDVGHVLARTFRTADSHDPCCNAVDSFRFEDGWGRDGRGDSDMLLEPPLS